MGFRWTGSCFARHGHPVLFLLPLFAALMPAAPGRAAKVDGVAVEAGRIVIRFDARVERATAAVMAGAHRRIAVDLTGVEPGRAGRAAGMVAAMRQARAGAGSRIEFDLAENAVIADGQFDAAGRELTLQLRPVDAATFRAASLAGPLDFVPFNLSFDRPRYKVSRAVPPAARRLPLPRVRGDDARPLVVIDAGHGGVDPGAVNATTGLREKDVTLRIAREIRDALLASGRVRVALTRENDKYLVLRERYGIARRLKADLFISVHCDSTGSEHATGASVYTLSEVASDKEAARLAARENKADVIAGVNLGEAGADVSSILIDLAQRETMNHSATFARLLGREAKGLVPLKPVFHRMASLMVLKAPDMPSILFETGYISNPSDAAFLASDDGRERIAQSVRRAVEVHFARRMAAR